MPAGLTFAIDPELDTCLRTEASGQQLPLAPPPVCRVLGSSGFGWRGPSRRRVYPPDLFREVPDFKLSHSSSAVVPCDRRAA